MTQHTKDKLGDALAAIPGVPEEMVRKAREGYYHDFLSPLTFPEIQLVHDLYQLAKIPATPRDSRPKLLALRQQVIDGEFDASKEESDEWAMSPEGQAAFQALLGGVRIDDNRAGDDKDPENGSV